MSQDHDANANEQGWDGQSVYGPSTVIAALDQIEDLVESARSIPLSASIMVNKAEILDLLDQAREALPEDLVAADAARPTALFEILIIKAYGRSRSCGLKFSIAFSALSNTASSKLPCRSSTFKIPIFLPVFVMRVDRSSILPTLSTSALSPSISLNAEDSV